MVCALSVFHVIHVACTGVEEEKAKSSHHMQAQW